MTNPPSNHPFATAREMPMGEAGIILFVPEICRSAILMDDTLYHLVGASAVIELSLFIRSFISCALDVRSVSANDRST